MITRTLAVWMRDVNKLITLETYSRSRTRTTTWRRFSLQNVFEYSQELKKPRKASLLTFFSSETLARLPLLKEVKPSLDRTE